MRRAARDLSPLGPRPGGDGARQRHRGGQDGARRGHGIEAVLAVQGPLPLREPVLQPLFGKREGLRRERRGAPPAQPPRPCVGVRRASRVRRVPRRGAREGQRGGALPRRQAARRGLPGGPRRHARPSRRGVRRGEVGNRPRRQARLRRGRRARVRRRARLARSESARRHARVDGGGPRRPRPPGRCPPPRAFGEGPAVRNPLSLVPAIIARPRAFGESTIRHDMPPGLVEGVDRMDSAGRRRTLRSIGRASESSGFEAACEAALRVVEGGRVPDDAAVDVLARRIGGGAGPAGPTCRSTTSS